MTTAQRKDYGSMTNEALNRAVAEARGFTCEPNPDFAKGESKYSHRIYSKDRTWVGRGHGADEAWLDYTIRYTDARPSDDANAALALLAEHGLMALISIRKTVVIVSVGTKDDNLEYPINEEITPIVDGDIAAATARAITIAFLAWWDASKGG